MARAVLAGIIGRALHHRGHVPPLDGGPGDHDHADSETDTADDDGVASLASYSCESVQPSRLQPPGSPQGGRGCFWPAMALPHHRADQLLRSIVSPVNLQLKNILEDHGVSGQVDEKLALEWGYLSALLPGAEGSQQCRGSTDASAFSFCVILPLQLTAPQCALDLTHKWWTEKRRPRHRHQRCRPPRDRGLQTHQAAFRPAVSPFLDRPSHGYRRSSRQVPASQCSAAALSLDGPRSFHGRISHPGVS